MGLLISQLARRKPDQKWNLFSKLRRLGPPGPFLFLVMWLICANWKAQGQSISHEYPLKAVFLVNFAQFTDWPTNAFDQPDSPLVIGILGTDPFGSLLDEAVRNETVRGRKIVVERYRHIADIKTCHILFISQSEATRLDQILALVRKTPVLTVSEITNSAYRGVCVRFITESNKIHLRINLDSVKAANLSMSSQLLRVAEIVSSHPNETAQ